MFLTLLFLPKKGQTEKHKLTQELFEPVCRVSTTLKCRGEVAYYVSPSVGPLQSCYKTFGVRIIIYSLTKFLFKHSPVCGFY